MKAVLAGDYALWMALLAVAKIGNTEVVKVISQVFDDLIAGTIHPLCSDIDVYMLQTCV